MLVNLTIAYDNIYKLTNMETKLRLLLRLFITICVLSFVQYLKAQCDASFTAIYVSGTSSLNCISTTTSSSNQFFYGDGASIMDLSPAAGGSGSSDFFYCVNQFPGIGSTPAAGWYSDSQNHLDRFYYWNGSNWDQTVNGGTGFISVQNSPCVSCSEVVLDL